MAAECTHPDGIRDVIAEGARGCEDCLRTGSRWSTWLCWTCANVGCCDDSAQPPRDRALTPITPDHRGYDPPEWLGLALRRRGVASDLSWTARRRRSVRSRCSV